MRAHGAAVPVLAVLLWALLPPLADATGAVRCWGRSDLGQTTVPSALLGDTKAISSGGRHSCAILTSNSSVVCWGDNSSGQTTVPSTIGAASAVSAGDSHTCAIRSNDNALVCWGSSSNGQATVPTLTGYKVLAVSAGWRHTCAVLNQTFSGTSTNVKCFGDDSGNQASPGNVVGLTASPLIAAGAYHTCVKSGTAAAPEIKCFGRNTKQQSSSPSQLNGNNYGYIDVFSLQSGMYHTCSFSRIFQFAVQSNKTFCWGSNDQGQAPTAVQYPPGLDGTVGVSAGGNLTCSLAASGAVSCYITNATYGEDTAPSGLGNSTQQLAVGGGHVCALVDDADECASGAVCGAQGTCTNTIGGYSCTCSSGWAFDGTTCVDLDECVKDTGICGKGNCTNTQGSYTCSCISGYTFNGATCTDVDECAKDAAICGKGTCTNTAGGYICKCSSGYTPNGTTCVDVDECLTMCGSKGNCTNTPGSYSCVCNSGFAVNASGICVDVDECASNSSICGNGSCTNVQGSYACLCNSGYIYTGATCIDVDECLTKCGSKGTCTNTPGSYSCVCNSGYVLDVSAICSDFNECTNNSAICGQGTCTNTAGGYNCSCSSGYSSNGTTCVDVNECLTKCGSKGTCTNTPGSYSCVCNSGYVLDASAICVDFNECTNNSTICGSGTCTNTAGGYTCGCGSGYTYDGTSCVDFNECTNNSAICGQGTCTNTAGGYTCSCSLGYTSNNITCVDVNECLTKCGSKGTCTNTPGSYSCVCNSGYALDASDVCADFNECTNNSAICGQGTCTNTAGGYSCSCSSGYTSNNITCVDVNECLTKCGSKGTCTNTPGSYSCVCNSGFAIDASGICVDFNECTSNPTICGNGTCANTAGGYNCSCSSGYTFDGTSCVDVDECSSGPCGSNGVCTNTPGGHSCSCNSGYALNATGYCEDTDECAAVPNNCSGVANSQCVNTDGGYSCECDPGYFNSSDACADVDECSADPSICNGTLNSHCNNTAGGYTCDCDPGFAENAGNCEDVDECAADPNTCSPFLNSHCNNTAGGYACLCDDGYDNSTGSCQLTDPCGGNTCPANSTCLASVGSYSCVCDGGGGWEYDFQTNSCTDVDECQADPCQGLGNCTNSPGSFSCLCIPGYSFDNTTCVDDCTLPGACDANGTAACSSGVCTCKAGFTGGDCGTDLCLVPGRCNATGTANCSLGNCTCNPGFSGDDCSTAGPLPPTDLCNIAGHCNATGTDSCSLGVCSCKANFTGDDCGTESSTPQRACDASGIKCDSNADCVTTDPTNPFCMCRDGFDGDGTVCTDLDECEMGFANCSVFANCTNTPGSFKCNCSIGFEGDGYFCAAISGTIINCDSLKCDVNAVCDGSMPGMPKCTCRPGYQGDGLSCKDVDECSNGQQICSQNAICTNTPGGYNCSCEFGYAGDGFNCTLATPTQCEANGLTCGANAACNATDPANVVCQCNPGFAGNGFKCTDVNECLVDRGGCHKFARCKNTAGAFECACKRGYVGDGFNCTAEATDTSCSAFNLTCGANAHCSSTDGVTAACSCDGGYTGDGVTCTDVNECLTFNGGCDAHADCTNTVGGSYCLCKAGWDGDGTTCKDVDECADGLDACSTHATCTNTPGNYTCQCDTGFVGNGYVCAAKGTVAEECKPGGNECDGNATCETTEVGHSCQCNDGYNGDGTKGGCTDINECATDSGGCGDRATCVNLQGSFRCDCDPGYFQDTLTGECTAGGDTYTEQKGFNYRRGELRALTENGQQADTAVACMERCLETDGCGYYTYNKDSKECWLKGDGPMVQEKVDFAVSGYLSGLSPVPNAGDPCNASLAGKPVPGSWDGVTAKCLAHGCKNTDLSKMPAGCEFQQCRWVVNPTPDMALYSEACAGGAKIADLSSDCLQVVFTGFTKMNCPGATAPEWAKVIIKNTNQLAWVPIFTSGSTGTVYHLDTCEFTQCDYKRTQFYSDTMGTMALMSPEVPAGLKRLADGARNPAPSELPVISVYFHLMTPGKKAASSSSGDNSDPNEVTAAYPSDDQLQRQVDALNAAYNPQGLTFQMAKKGKKNLVDRKKLAKLGAYGYEIVPGGDLERQIAEKIWPKPKKGKPNHVPTDLHIVLNQLDSPKAYVTTFPWAISSTDAADMRRGTANHDLIVMDHDCIPGTSSQRHGGDAPCGAAAIGKPFEGYILVHEVGHWLGLWDTFGIGALSSVYSLTNPTQLRECGDPLVDQVADTPAQWAPTYGCELDPSGNPQYHPDVANTVGFASTDPRCKGEAAYPDPNNAMNYYWWHGGCSGAPSFTAGQGERLRTLFETLRVSNKYRLGDSIMQNPVEGGTCGKFITDATLSSPHGRCMQVSDCAARGSVSVETFPSQSGEDSHCEGPAGTVQCCLPTACLAKRNKAGYCAAEEICAYESGNAKWVTKAKDLKEPCAAGSASAAGCCVPPPPLKLPPVTPGAAGGS